MSYIYYCLKGRGYDNEQVNSSQLQCKCGYECLASLQTLDMQVLQNTNKIFARRTGRTQQTKRHK